MGRHGLRVLRYTFSKSADGIRYTWTAVGRSDRHHDAMKELVASDLVKDFEVLLFDELN